MNRYFYIVLAILIATTFAVADENNVTVKTGALQLGGYIQTGYYSQSDKTTPPTGEATTVNTDTFKVRRARVKISSTIIEKIVGGTLEYDFSEALSSTVSGSSATALSGLKEGFFWFSPCYEPLTLSIGRTKLPWMQEYLTSSSELLWVDRSIAADKFNYEFDYGLRLDLKAPVAEGHKVMAALMYSNGYSPSGSIQATDIDTIAKEVTSKEDSAHPGTFIYDKKTSEEKDLKDITARLGWEGKFSDDFKMMVGIGIMTIKDTKFDAGTTTAPNPIVTTLERQPITADLTVNAIKGLSVLGAYTMDTKKSTVDAYSLDATSGDISITSTESKYTLNGMMGGLAFNIPIEGAPVLTGLEPAVRYASYDETDDVTAAGVTNTASKTNITQIAGGLNFYMSKHNAKLQLDYVVQNEKDTPYSAGVAGDITKKDTNKIQAQFQVKF